MRAPDEGYTLKFIKRYNREPFDYIRITEDKKCPDWKIELDYAEAQYPPINSISFSPVCSYCGEMLVAASFEQETYVTGLCMLNMEIEPCNCVLLKMKETRIVEEKEKI